MTLSALRPTFLLVTLALLLLVACVQPDFIELPFESVVSAEYAPVTIANEATLKGEGNVSAKIATQSQTDYDPVTIVNEAELKGDGIAGSQPYVMSEADIAALKTAPFSIINEALLKGDGIYTER